MASSKLDIQLATVDALITEFRKRWDFEDDDVKMIEDFKEALRANATDADKKKIRKSKKKVDSDDENAEDKPARKKREPSPYNLYVKSKWDEIAAAGFKGRDIIREAARMWNEERGKKADEEHA